MDTQPHGADAKASRNARSGLWRRPCCATSVNPKERCVTDNTRGGLLMLASMLAFTVNDASIKATDGALPFFQLLFLRGVLSTCLIAVALWWLGIGHWRLAIACAPGGSQVDCSALLVRNCRHDVLSHCDFSTCNWPISSLCYSCCL